MRTVILDVQPLRDALTGSGALTIRAAARRVGRDVKAVHSDIKMLLDAGLLQRDESRKIFFPYDAVHVEFTLRAA
jgi:predicted transcriptional regulator